MPLIIAGNSLGNHSDIPIRSLEAAANADVIVFEEDREARQILKNAGVHREYLKLNEHSKKEDLDEIETALKNKKNVIYMSDQGMPGNADPGWQLLNLAYRLKEKIEIIPGPCSISAAIAAYPQKINRYIYEGFLPRDERARIQSLEKIKSLDITTVILDTPYRLTNLLKDVKVVFGGNKKLLLATNIGNKDEAYEFAYVTELLRIEKNKCLFVLVI
jgi:16S rRNA (cytidine1402-2'-O)-methyltransferase